MYNISVLGGHSAVSQNALAGMLTSITITTWSEEQSIAGKIHFASTIKYTIVLEMSCFCWIGHYNTHKTNYCWNYLQRKESAGTLKIMDWTPQSPDRNSIEQFWGDMENKLEKEKGKESLWLELQNAWDNISVEVLRKYMWHYIVREMCCCNIHYLVYCCAQNNHLHVSWKMEKGETPPTWL